MSTDRGGQDQGTVGRNSMRVLASQIAGNSGYFAAVLLLARALGPAERGTVAFITVTALVTSQAANLGVADATSVMAARSPELRPALLANITLLALAGSAIVGASTAVVLEFLPGVRPAGIGTGALVILAVACTVTAATVAGYGYLRGCGHFGAYSRVQATAPWMYAACLGIAQATVGLTVVRAAVIWTVVQALSGARLLLAAGSLSGWVRPDLRLLVASIRFGSRAWVGSLSRLLNARTDQIITGLIATEATLGIYAVAVNASEVLYYLPGAAAAALLPAVAGNPDAGTERTLRVFRSVLLLTTFACLLGAIAGPLALPLVFGHAYRGAVGPFLILIPSAIGFATMNVFTGSTLGSLAPGRSSIGPLVALITQTTLDFILIPSLHASGAAIAATTALLAGGIVALAVYRSRFPFPWRALLPGTSDLSLLGRLARRLLRGPAVAAP